MKKFVLMVVFLFAANVFAAKPLDCTISSHFALYDDNGNQWPLYETKPIKLESVDGRLRAGRTLLYDGAVEVVVKTWGLHRAVVSMQVFVDGRLITSAEGMADYDNFLNFSAYNPKILVLANSEKLTVEKWLDEGTYPANENNLAYTGFHCTLKK